MKLMLISIIILIVFVLGFYLGCQVNSKPILNIDLAATEILNEAREYHSEEIISFDGDYYFMRNEMRCQVYNHQFRQNLRNRNTKPFSSRILLTINK